MELNITNWADMSELVKKNPGNEISYKVARAGAVETLLNLLPPKTERLELITLEPNT